MKRVVLVGLGLIGGSIGLALRKSFPRLEIVGIDSQAVIQSEKCQALLTRGIGRESLADTTSAALDADLVVLAVPVCEIERQVCNWLEARVPVTDCGSTKRTIVQAADLSPKRDWFLPGHPMAGREKGGLASGDPDLFRSRRWIVCPQATRHEVLEVTRVLVYQLGAIWTEMTPSEHDAAVAFTSHLPQVLASWLVANTSDSIQTAAGPAFADMTRVAGGSEAMWNDIFLTNSEALAKALQCVAGDLAALARTLSGAEPDVGPLLELLARARSRAGQRKP